VVTVRPEVEVSERVVVTVRPEVEVSERAVGNVPVGASAKGAESPLHVDWSLPRRRRRLRPRHRYLNSRFLVGPPARAGRPRAERSGRS